MNICVFASGKGSNFSALLEAKKEGVLDSEFKLLITNNPDSGAFKTAAENNIKTFCINRKIFPSVSEKDYSEKFLNVLYVNKINFIILAGYMQLIPSEVIKKFQNRIINIHPALLPLFGGKGMYGMKVHEAVIESGMKVSGITIHFVTENYDEGKIILQKCVEVGENETPESLSKKIQMLEHEFYPAVVRKFETGEISFTNNQ